MHLVTIFSQAFQLPSPLPSPHLSHLPHLHWLNTWPNKHIPINHLPTPSPPTLSLTSLVVDPTSSIYARPASLCRHCMNKVVSLCHITSNSALPPIWCKWVESNYTNQHLHPNTEFGNFSAKLKLTNPEVSHLLLLQVMDLGFILI